MAVLIDPWGSILIKDYRRMIKEFGLSVFDPGEFPEPNRLMRRGVNFAGRDLKQISDAIKNRKKYYVLSGIMPSAEKIHLGNKMVVENIRYFQEHRAQAYILVADLEAAATRGIPLEEARKRAMNFHIPAWIALGLDPKKTTFYFQSQNRLVMNYAYEFSKKITLSEFEAIYGSAEPGRIMSAVAQSGDMIFPQAEERMPGIIPVGIDQDPHIRLCRDIIRRTKRHKFFMISSLYNKYTPSLDGSLKMSKSVPGSCIELPEDPEAACRKIRKAFSGGRNTLEEHRRLGGMPERDMAFELLKQHLIEDDRKLQEIHDDYKSGKMTAGDMKELACEKMAEFMREFERKMTTARKAVDKLNFIEF